MLGAVIFGTFYAVTSGTSWLMSVQLAMNMGMTLNEGNIGQTREMFSETEAIFKREIFNLRGL